MNSAAVCQRWLEYDNHQTARNFRFKMPLLAMHVESFFLARIYNSMLWFSRES